MARTSSRRRASATKTAPVKNSAASQNDASATSVNGDEITSSADSSVGSRSDDTALAALVVKSANEIQDVHDGLIRKSSRNRREPERFTTSISSGKENEQPPDMATKRRKTSTEHRRVSQFDEDPVMEPEHSDRESNDDRMEDLNELEAKDQNYGQPLPKGARRKVHGKVKPVPTESKKVATRPKPHNEKGSLALYDVLLDTPVSGQQALVGLATNWVQEYLVASPMRNDSSRPYNTASEDEAHAHAWAKFVNLLLQASGCSRSISWEVVLDLDRVVESLSEVQADLKRDTQSFATSASYPLVSKSKNFKKFKGSLGAFIRQWCLQAAEAEILYHDTFLEVAHSWLSALSTSGIRNFRHTATYAALAIESALVEVWRDAIKTRENLSRQLQTEGGRSRINQNRVQTLQSQLSSAGRKEDSAHEFVDDWFTTIFLHRYRDVEPVIRVECVAALASWIHILPNHFLANDYLKYVGWMFSDKSSPVRLEAVETLRIILADSGDQANAQQVRQFIDRFKSRLVEIALRDVDASVKISVIDALGSMQEKGFLTENLKWKVFSAIFDSNAGVREAVSKIVASHLLEQIEHESHKEIALARDSVSTLRILTKFLTRLQRHCEGPHPAISQVDHSLQDFCVLAKAGGVESRFSLAIRALWTSMPVLQNVKLLCQLSLTDHSVSASASGSLSDLEETALLEILLSSISRISEIYPSEEGTIDQFGRGSSYQKSLDLVEALGKLYEKHHSHKERLLPILHMMVYLDPKNFSAALTSAVYEGLWSIASTQFLQQNDSEIVAAASAVVQLLSQVGQSAFSDATFEKLHFIYENVTNAIRSKFNPDGTFDVRDLATESTTDLCADIFRLSLLAKHSDVHSLFEDTSEGEVLPLFDLLTNMLEDVDSLYEANARMMTVTVEAVFMYLTWRMLSLGSQQNGFMDDDEKKDLNARKTQVMDLLRRAMCSASEGKAADLAFRYLTLLLELLASDFISNDSHSSKEAHFLRYKVSPSLSEDLSNHLTRILDGYSKRSEPERLKLAQDFQFVGNVSTFARLVCKNVLDLSLAAPLFMVLSRIDDPFLERIAVEVRDCVKDAELSLAHPEAAARLVLKVLTPACEEHLKDATTCPLDAVVKVARLLSGLTVTYGTGLKILGRLKGTQMTEIHTTLIDLMVSSASANSRADKKAPRSLFILKVLSQLTAALHLNDALRIKAHLDSKLFANGLKPMPFGADKAWDNYHGYIKRFDTIITRSGVNLNLFGEERSSKTTKRIQPRPRPVQLVSEDQDDPIVDFDPSSELSVEQISEANGPAAAASELI